MPAFLALPDLATSPDPAAGHALLRGRGACRTPDGWAFSAPDDVARALADPALAVPAPTLPDGAARDLLLATARFCDGPAHAARRALALRLLPGVDGLEGQAHLETTAALAGASGPLDAAPLARRVPVAVLARALGVPAPRRDEVAEQTGRLCDAALPRLGPAPVPVHEGDAAARRLLELLAPAGPPAVRQAAAGLLVQARDATAGLVGGALLAGGPVPAALERVLRRDAPVQSTRRVAVEDVRVGGALVRRGEPVWLLLAAAEQGPPAPPATFGAGRHACPGPAHAVALARGVLTALHDAGWRPGPPGEVRYEPRPTLRCPAQVPGVLR